MVFLVEAVIACLVFTVLVVRSVTKDPGAWVLDYPPAIVERVRQQGLLPVKQTDRKQFILGKAVKSVVIAAFITVLVVFVNGAKTFWEGALICYGLWAIVAWYDAIVIDCLWFCHSKKIIIPGTEDMTEAYHDYFFHIKMSCIGMVLGIPVSLLVGLMTAAVQLLR